jgi:hypothetical protein
MAHIDTAGGRFVTVPPRTRKEDGWFRDWLSRATPAWTEAIASRPARPGSHPTS